MSKFLIEQRNGFTGKMPAVIARTYCISNGSELVEIDKATWDAAWDKSYAERISVEAAYAAVTEQAALAA